MSEAEDKVIVAEAESSDESVAESLDKADAVEAGNDPNGPLIQHNDFKELTPRAFILAAGLSVLLGAANVYLGLLVGLTVSASIPASVMSLAIMKLLGGSNVLESNIVQTGASAGEALAAGVIFTLPGLIVLQNSIDNNEEGYENVFGWTTFMGSNYLIVTFMALCGGVLGIMFSIPIRRALLVELTPKLKFPEGVATSKVLLSGSEGGNSVLAVLCGGGVGAMFTILKSVNIYKESISGAFQINGSPFQMSMNAKAALLAVGFIVGPNIGIVLMVGALLNYFVAIPINWAMLEDPFETYGLTEDSTPAERAGASFGETRYIGVGLMIVGGIWALISVRHAIKDALKFGVKSLRNAGEDIGVVPRYEQDLDFKYMLPLIGASLAGFYLIVSLFAGNFGFTIILVLVSFCLAFVFSAVAAYMAGLVGSSNNPVSGVTLCSGLVISVFVLLLFGDEDPLGPAIVVVCCCAIASACAISGDNMQDLACGHILGATPRSQQIIMVVGVSAVSFVVAPILELLQVAYGIGNDAELGQLPAPQASFIAQIPVGILKGGLPFLYIGVGVALGIFVVILDLNLAKSNSSWRIPTLALAVAVYLPISYITPIFLGSIIHLIIRTSPDDASSEGVLYGAGLIAGESLLAIFLAIPIVVTADSSVLVPAAFSGEDYTPFVGLPWIATIFLMGSIGYFAKVQPFTKGNTKTEISR
mmetsp:Transcript_18434/g.34131  ORF Transcript_18434/g.34131 Transcript_18434/m.34131 type:complete len:703 (+) Transcript_18434:69-2177(+)